MNPFDLKGPEFLQLYLVAAGGAFLAATLLRYYLRPGGEPDARSFDLDCYEVAYLGGGPMRAAEAAIAALVEKGILAVDPAERRVTRKLALPPERLHPLEKGIAALLPEGEQEGHVFHASAVHETKPLEGKLARLGLVMRREGGQGGVRLVSLLPIGAVAAFGAVKIWVGLSRDRPVFFLVMLVAVTVVLGLLAFARPVHRTRRGDLVLNQLERDNAALRIQSGVDRAQLSPNDLALAVGLFGLSMVPFEVQTALRRPDASGSSCGGGSCGGGSCGGGCGGGCGGCG